MPLKKISTKLLKLYLVKSLDQTAQIFKEKLWAFPLEQKTTTGAEEINSRFNQALLPYACIWTVTMTLACASVI